MLCLRGCRLNGSLGTREDKRPSTVQALGESINEHSFSIEPQEEAQGESMNEHSFAIEPHEDSLCVLALTRIASVN
jgi:hypothetical protein